MHNSIIFSFFHWFFAVAPADAIRLSRNFLLWDWHFFSIGYFMPRLFSPWHRDITGYGRGFDLKRFLHEFGWNLISRIIGGIMRIFVMAFGLLVLTVIGITGVFVFAIWFILPLLGIFLVGLGIYTLIALV